MPTTKDAAVTLRGFIRKSQEAHRLNSACTWTIPGEGLETVVLGDLPVNLRFEVRATRTGVNVTIQDDGYVDEVTGGNRKAFGKPRADFIVKCVDELRRLWPNGLPGTTKWGPIFISARVTTVTHVDRYGNETTEEIA